VTNIEPCGVLIFVVSPLIENGLSKSFAPIQNYFTFFNEFLPIFPDLFPHFYLFEIFKEAVPKIAETKSSKFIPLNAANFGSKDLSVIPGIVLSSRK